MKILQLNVNKSREAHGFPVPWPAKQKKKGKQATSTENWITDKRCYSVFHRNIEVAKMGRTYV